MLRGEPRAGERHGGVQDLVGVIRVEPSNRCNEVLRREFGLSLAIGAAANAEPTELITTLPVVVSFSFELISWTGPMRPEGDNGTTVPFITARRHRCALGGARTRTGDR